MHKDLLLLIRSGCEQFCASPKVVINLTKDYGSVLLLSATGSMLKVKMVRDGIFKYGISGISSVALTFFICL